MWDKLETIVRRYESLEQELAVPGGDYQRYAALGKERADLEPLVRAYRAWRTVQDQLKPQQLQSELKFLSPHCCQKFPL